MRERFIRGYKVKEYYGFDIYKEYYKLYDDIMGEYKGHEKVGYTVMDSVDNDVIGNFKTLAEATAYIRKII